jgi:drug/metabolite transporter (DMT)-like permease
MRQQLSLPAALGLASLCAIWGLGQVAIKIANAGISPIMQAGLRSLIAGICLLVWCRVRRIPLFEHDGTLRSGIGAGLLFALEVLLLFLALQYTTAARGTLFLNTSPFVVAIGAHLFLTRDQLSRTKLMGLTLAFAGVAIAFGDSLAMPDRTALLGDALCVGGAIAWGATTVLIKGSKLAHVSAEKTLMYQLVLSSAALIGASLLVSEAGVFRLNTPVLLALAYQGVIIAFVSYVLWFWFLARYPASRVAAFVFLTPVFGVIAGALVLNEPITAALLIALALIAAGIYLVNRPVPEPVNLTGED